MQIEENESNDHLFDESFSFITVEGELKQKDNSYFEGKTLKTDVKDAFLEHIKPFKDAFTELETSLKTKATSVTFDELKQEAAQAEAIGDFDALLNHLQEFQKSTAEDATPEPTEPDKSVESATTVEQIDEETSGETSPPVVETITPEPAETEAAKDIDSTDSKESSETAQSVETVEKTSEEVTPPAVETKPSKPAETVPSTEEEKPETEAGKVEAVADRSADSDSETDEPIKYFKDLVSEAEEIATSNNWAKGQALLDIVTRKWSEGPDVDESELKPLHDALEKAKQTFGERKLESQKKYEERREKNFLTREELLTRFEKLIEQKKWQAQGEVNGIQRKFETLRPLPATGVEEQDKKLRELMATFDQNRIDYMVEIRQKEEDNFTGKLITVEKMEGIINDANEKTESWTGLEKDLDQLNRQWKKIGRIPKERENELWDRYRKLQDLFLEKRLKFDTEFKKVIEKNISRREKLIAKAESLHTVDNLAANAVTINRLHSDWKKLDNLPKELNDELWDRFKAASDKFNEIKAENQDILKQQEQENLDQKEALCVQAEALSSEEKFRDGTKKMDKLFEEWKQLGPVPGKKSSQLWRRFRKAMDAFYNARRAHFKELKSEQQENLNKKKAIVDRLKELAATEDPASSMNEVKEIQEQYKAIGFVPIKMKDKIWDNYREACDLYYNAVRQKGGTSTGGGSNERRRHHGSDSDSGDRQINSEIFKLRKEADKLREEIMKYSDTMTYFKPNKKGLELRNEIQGNIDEKEVKLEKIIAKIEELHQQMASKDEE
jgi:hypothetical protein